MQTTNDTPRFVLPMELVKSARPHKYIRRWKGKDGAWQYEYADGKKKKKGPPEGAEIHEVERYSDAEAEKMLREMGEYLDGLDDVREVNKVGFSREDKRWWIGEGYDASLHLLRRKLQRYRKQLAGAFGEEAVHRLGFHVPQDAVAPPIKAHWEIHPRFKSLNIGFEGYIADKAKFRALMDYHKSLGMWKDFQSGKFVLRNPEGFDFEAYQKGVAEILGDGAVTFPDESPFDKAKAAEEAARKQAEEEKRLYTAADKTRDAVKRGDLDRGIVVEWDPEDRSFTVTMSKQGLYMGTFGKKKGIIKTIANWNMRLPETSPYVELKMFNLEDLNRALDHIRGKDPRAIIVTEGVEEAGKAQSETKAKEQAPIPEVTAKLAPGVELMAHQNEAVRFMMRNNGNVLIGDEMGTGKTIQALSYVAATGAKAIVVVPKPMRGGWVDQAGQFFPGMKARELDPAELIKVRKQVEKEFATESKAAGEDPDDIFNLLSAPGRVDAEVSKRLGLDDADVVTVNYESLTKFQDLLEGAGFDTLIVDESHRMKNPEAQVTKAIQQVAKGTKHRILMSGTAVKNERAEFFTQFALVKPGAYKTPRDIKNRTIGQLWDEMRPFYMARAKEDVLTGLPDKTTDIVKGEMEGAPDLPRDKDHYLDLMWWGIYDEMIEPDSTRKDPGARDGYPEDVAREIADDATAEEAESLKDMSPEEIRKEILNRTIQKFTKVRYSLAKKKTKITVPYVKEILAGSDSNVLVFTESLHAAKKLAAELGDVAELHTGATPEKKRREIRAKFYPDTREPGEKKRVIVATRPSLAEGVTLTSIDKVVFNDLPWTAAAVRQAEDRTHRIGQKRNVNVSWMTVKDNEMDGLISNLIKMKYELDRRQTKGKNITPEERAWMDSEISPKEMLAKLMGVKTSEPRETKSATVGKGKSKRTVTVDRPTVQPEGAPEAAAEPPKRKRGRPPKMKATPPPVAEPPKPPRPRMVATPPAQAQVPEGAGVTSGPSQGFPDRVQRQVNALHRAAGSYGGSVSQPTTEDESDALELFMRTNVGQEVAGGKVEAIGKEEWRWTGPTGRLAYRSERSEGEEGGRVVYHIDSPPAPVRPPPSPPAAVPPAEEGPSETVEPKPPAGGTKGAERPPGAKSKRALKLEAAGQMTLFKGQRFVLTRDGFDSAMRKVDRLVKSGGYNQALDLIKAATHKYLRRIPTGDAKRKWRYVYAETATAMGAEHAEGEKIKVAHGGKLGHYEIERKHPGGWLTVKHDETGHYMTIHQDELRGRFKQQHEDRIDAAHKRLTATLAAARKHGTRQQQDRAKTQLEQYRRTWGIDVIDSPEVPRVTVRDWREITRDEMQGQIQAMAALDENSLQDALADLDGRIQASAKSPRGTPMAWLRWRTVVSTALGLRQQKDDLDKTAGQPTDDEQGATEVAPTEPAPKPEPEPPADETDAKAAAMKQHVLMRRLMKAWEMGVNTSDAYGALYEHEDAHGLEHMEDPYTTLAFSIGAGAGVRKVKQLIADYGIRALTRGMDMPAGWRRATKDDLTGPMPGAMAERALEDPHAFFIVEAKAEAPKPEAPKPTPGPKPAPEAREVAPAPPSTPRKVPAPAAGLQRVGDHVWGSKKDKVALRGKDITPDVIASMPFHEAAALVTKANLIEPHSAATCKALGMTPGAAHLCLQWIAAIKSKPGDTDAERRAYVERAHHVVESLKNVRTIDDFNELRREIYREQSGAPTMQTVEQLPEGSTKEDLFARIKELQAANPGAKYEGFKPYHSMQYGIRVKVAKPYDVLGPRFVTGMRLKGKTWNEAVHTAYVADAVQSGKEPDSGFSDGWAFLEASNESREAKKKATQEKTQRKKEKKAEEGKTSRGFSWAKAYGKRELIRKGGRAAPKDANPDRVQSRFNLREIDYGTYLSQADREHHTMQLEAALGDLADSLGVPDNVVSFKGRLAMALGARGSGNVLAHYEGGRGVINLTKMKGGGSLAHEWGHALDNIIAAHYTRQEGRGAGNFLTDMPNNPGIPADVREALQDVLRAIKKDPNPEKARARHREVLQKAIDAEHEDVKKLRELKQERRAIVDKPATREIADKFVAKLEEQNAQYEKELPELLDKKSQKAYMRRANLEYWIKDNQKKIAAYKRPEALRTAEETARLELIGLDIENAEWGCEVSANEVKRIQKIDPEASDYVKHAQALGKYWVRPVELFARAFEAYTDDKLRAKGMQNTYLVKDTKAALDTGVDLLTGTTIHPYPQDETRAAINKAMGRFMDLIVGGGHLAKALRTLPDARYVLRK